MLEQLSGPSPRVVALFDSEHAKNERTQQMEPTVKCGKQVD
jgi:hypothetical protein